ncbi:CcdB family protein [Sphingomonas sp. RP10(2022)]|uniref:Toxin CcdB n=1 Tax=Sphingomonas liriopis TaxID=2949094 RepID=A0A9X2KRE4_9SPHN|nr:CcdB family protein [Sphingomonas liriopis]MCP3735521.1 CcdB family protein [Sphingomonas liriopis]
MARFDVYHFSGGGLVVDCQADDFDDIGTRFVIPLMPPGEIPPTNRRLNPSFDVNGETLFMLSQFATAVRTVELKSRVCSLAQHHIAIITAIDTLVGSY